MTDHRIRLDDRELELVVSALRARMAGVGRAKRLELGDLVARLDNGSRGNPDWIIGRQRPRPSPGDPQPVTS